MVTARWHGTAGGYSNHGCRCPDCRDAWRRASGPIARAWEAKQRATGRCVVCRAPALVKWDRPLSRCAAHLAIVRQRQLAYLARIASGLHVPVAKGPRA